MTSLGRRRFLQVTGLSALFSLLARTGEAATFFLRRFLSAATRETKLITPNHEFYIVNYSKPREVKLSEWFLTIKGFVKNPMILRYEEILARPWVERGVTLQCIDNEVAGDLISNAIWRGVPLRSILEEAEPLPQAEDCAFYGMDDYSDSITLDRAMNFDVMLAYQMNGKDLPPAHGYPLRVVVPGIYGIKNVKWLTKIELTNHDYKGYWQQRGWTDEGVIKVTSRIDAPGPFNEIRTTSTVIRGIAFGGGYGIKKVEVSVDGGTTWNPAQLDPPLSPYSWVVWRYLWTPPAPGSYKIMVRAEDRLGRKQSASMASAFPDGTSGLHTIVAYKV